MQDTFTYYAIDLPGSGMSPAPDDFDYSLESLADVTAEFIIRKDLKRLTIFGASLGGGVALLALLRKHDALNSRVRSLCLIDGIAYPQEFPFFVGLLRVPVFGPALAELISPEAQARAVLNYCYFNDALITETQVREYAKYFGRREVRKAIIKMALALDAAHLSKYIPKLKTIAIPSLLIWGREDQVVPLNIGQRLAGELQHAHLDVIDQCGHMPQEERPQETIAAIRAFYSSLKSEP